MSQELANLPTVELFQKDGSPSARKLFILWNPALRPKTVSWSSVVLVKQYNSSSANGKHILTNQMLLLLDCSYPVKLGLLWIMMSWQMKVLILFVQGDNSHMFNDKKFCNYWFNAYSLILTSFLMFNLSVSRIWYFICMCVCVCVCVYKHICICVCLHV
jgi:hypothetical protein